MDAEKVAGIVRAAVARMGEGATRIAPVFEEEEIHSFRVETKRLRAFLRLVESEEEAPGFKLGKRFKGVYAAAGAVRDPQMHLVGTVRACEKALSHYALWLATSIGSGQRTWEEAYRPKVFNRMIEEVEATSWPAVSIPTVRRYYAERVASVDAILRTPTLDDEDIHTVRKSVKDLQHTTRIFRESWPEAIEALHDFPLDRLDELGKKAGDFNDHRNAIDALDRYLAGGRPEKEAAALAPIREAWEQIADRDRAALLNDIHTFKEEARGAVVAHDGDTA